MSKLVISNLTAAHRSTLMVWLLIKHRVNLNFAFCYVFCAALRDQIDQGSLGFRVLSVV